MDKGKTNIIDKGVGNIRNDHREKEPIDYRLAYTEAQKKRDNYAIPREVIRSIMGLGFDEGVRESDINNIYLAHGGWPAFENEGYQNRTLNTKGVDGVQGNLQMGRVFRNHYGGAEGKIEEEASYLMEIANNWEIKDFSENGTLASKEDQIAKIKSFVSTTYVQPLIKRAAVMVQQRMGGINPMQMADEEQIAQYNSQVDAQVQEMMDPKIKQVMTSTDTKTKKLWRRILEISLEQSGFEYEMFKASMSTVANYKVFFRKRVGIDGVRMEHLDEVNTIYKMSKRSEFIDDGLLLRNDRYLTPAEMISEHMGILIGKSLKEIEMMLSPVPDHAFRGGGDADHNILIHPHDYSNDPQLSVKVAYPRIDHERKTFSTESLPDQLGSHLFVEQMGDHLNNMYKNGRLGFRSSFMTWRWSTMGRLITRTSKNRGVHKVIRPHHYQFNKMNGDISQDAIPIPATYECEDAEGVVLDYGMVKYQYETPGDFRYPKLSVYGGVFGSDNGRIENISGLDNAKIHILRRNVLMDVLNDNIEKDLGAVLAVDKSIINDAEGGPEGFWSTLYEDRTITHNKSAKGGRFDYSDMTVLNLNRMSNNREIRENIEFYERQIEDKLSSRDSLRSQGYRSRAAINSESEQFNRKNHRMFTLWSMCKERMYNGMARAAFYHYIKDDEFCRMHFSDDIYAHYINNFPEIAGSFLKVVVTDGMEDKQILDAMKNIIPSYAATSDDPLDSILKGMKAKTIGEMEEIGQKVSTEIDKARKEEAERRERIAQQDRQAMIEAERIKAESIEKRSERQVQASMFNSSMNSNVMLNAQDVDKDGVADHVAKASQDRAQREKEFNEKMKLEREKVKSHERIAKLKEKKNNSE